MSAPFFWRGMRGKKLAEIDYEVVKLIPTSREDRLDFMTLIELYSKWSDASTVPADFLHATCSTFLPVNRIQFPSESEDDDWDRQVSPPNSANTKRQRTSHKGTGSTIDGPPTTVDDAPSLSELAARTRKESLRSNVASSIAAQATVELGVDIKATRMIVTLDVHVCTKFLLFVPEYNLRWPIISIHIELHSFTYSLASSVLRS